MDTENNTVQTGRYNGGISLLAAALKWAFAFLLTLIILMLVYFVSWGGYFSVEPQQAVIVLRFGKISECLTSGAHWYFPYPVNSFVTIQTSQQFLNVDITASGNSPDSAGKILQPGRDQYLITGDANIVHTSWNIGYRISNPVKYYSALTTAAKPVVNGVSVEDPQITDADGINGARGPRTLLRNLFRDALIQITSCSKVDAILSADQSIYSEKVRKIFSQAVLDADCGMEIVSVTLNRISPPEAAKKAFENVTAANNAGDTLRSQAKAYMVETQNDAAARKAEILAEAETYRRQAVAVVRAESNYFESILGEYRKNSATILMTLYNDALSEAIESVKDENFVIGTSGAKGKQLRLKLNQGSYNNAPNDKEAK